MFRGAFDDNDLAMSCGMNLQLGWIPVRRSVSKDADVKTEDSIDIAVRLLPILDEGILDTMLREHLEKGAGWERKEDGTLTKQFGEVTATLPAGSSTITLAIEAETSVSATVTQEGLAPDEAAAEADAIAARAERLAKKKIDAVADAARRELEQRNVEALIAAEAEVQQEVREATNRTTKRALERRAAQLGDIESMEERGAPGGAEGYEVTITVKT